MIEAVKLGWKAFIEFRDVIGGVVAFILRRFADMATGFGVVLTALGKIPGFDWAKRAGEDLQVAATAAEKLATAIDNIPDANIKINMTAGGVTKSEGGGAVTSGRVFVPGVGWVNAAARARGGPVKAGQPYIVGEKRPELFVPNQSGKIIPKVPTGSGEGGAGVVQNFNGNIVAHDYADFERQMDEKRRRSALGVF
jgi:hypothetical protein